MAYRDKSSLMAQVAQIAAQANQLLIAVSEFTGEPASLPPTEQPAPEPKRSVITKDILNVEEAAEFMGRSKQAVYALVHRRELQRRGKGRKAYFKRSDLEEFMLRDKQSTSTELRDHADGILNGRKK